jgi:4-amino-4-deoxy-L-arabinose transferase-like glycosyltransferase
MDLKAACDGHHFASAEATNASWQAIGLCVLLIVFSTLSLSANLQKSPTADENYHLVAGYSYLLWRDYRINPEHPPLAKLLAALPLLGIDINNQPLTQQRRDEVQVNGRYGWLLANQWLFSNNDAEELLFYAKLPMIALGAMLGLLVFCWARELYGQTAAFASLALYVFDPNILAHSAIIHTDLPFALTFCAGTYYFWRTAKEVTWFNWLMTIGFFALSAVTKFSFVIILPIWSVLAFCLVFSSTPIRSRITSVSEITGRWHKAGLLAAIFVSAIMLAYLTIWLAYGFRYDAVGGQVERLMIPSGITPSPWLMPWVPLNAKYHLLPEAWFYGLVYALSTFNRTAYLLGEISGQGFLLYFPIAFATKTPLSTLLLLIIALILFLEKNELNKDFKFLLIPILLFVSFAVLSRMNIGLRHILPVYPFLFVWLGGSVKTLWSSRSLARKSTALLLVIWLACSSINTYPDYLAFFNEAVGSRNRHQILVDSNLDWGQDLKGLKRWMDENDVGKIRLAYFGTADPAYYGIDAIPQPEAWSSEPQSDNTLPGPAYIAISATHLASLYFWPSKPYERYLDSEPEAIIGGSIHVYKIRDRR